MILKNVHAHYETTTDLSLVVDDVPLPADGEVLGIVGESGCGKSTLASAISPDSAPPLHVAVYEMVLDGEKITLDRPSPNPPRLARAQSVTSATTLMNSLNPTACASDSS